MRNAIRESLKAAEGKATLTADSVNDGVVMQPTPDIYDEESADSIEDRAEAILALVKKQDEY